MNVDEDDIETSGHIDDEDDYYDHVVDEPIRVEPKKQEKKPEPKKVETKKVVEPVVVEEEEEPDECEQPDDEPVEPETPEPVEPEEDEIEADLGGEDEEDFEQISRVKVKEPKSKGGLIKTILNTPYLIEIAGASILILVFVLAKGIGGGSTSPNKKDD